MLSPGIRRTCPSHLSRRHLISRTRTRSLPGHYFLSETTRRQRANMEDKRRRQKTWSILISTLLKSSDRKLPDRKNDEILCNGFAEFFEEKIQKVVGFTRSKVTIEAIVMPALPAAPSVSKSLHTLCSTDAEELQAIIKSRPTKCCPLDVLPTWLVKTTLTAMLFTLL